MIERLRKLDTEATPGPWRGTTIGNHSQRDAAAAAYEAVMARRIEGWELSDLSWVRTEGDVWLNIACVGNGPNGPENAAYIAALRNAAPKLYAVVEAAAAHAELFETAHPVSVALRAALCALEDER